MEGIRRRATATLLAPVSWGTTYVTVTELLPEGRPLLVSAIRVVPAAALLIGLGLAQTGGRLRGMPWRRTIVLALLNFGLFFPLLTIAVYRLPGGVAAAAGGLQPLLVAGLTRVASRRSPQASELGIAAAAAVGVGLVVLRPGPDLDLVGVAAAVAANTSFAAGVVLTKRLAPPANRYLDTGLQLLLSGVLLVPTAVALEGWPSAVDARNVAGFGYLSLVATGAAFVLWFEGIARLPAFAPPLLGLAAPVTGAVLGWLLLGQSLSPVQLVGFAVTVAAIGYGATARSPDQPWQATDPGLDPASRDRA